MTQEEWDLSQNASEMLCALQEQRPRFFANNIDAIQRFMIACCWKNQHLIPQKALREGLTGAERWLEGEIDYEELNRLNWNAEAEAFFLDYSKEPDEIEKIKAMIEGINEIDEMPFDKARALLKRAAYFAEVTMVFQGMRPKPRAWRSIICRSAEFLCADILRARVTPKLD